MKWLKRGREEKPAAAQAPPRPKAEAKTRRPWRRRLVFLALVVCVAWCLTVMALNYRFADFFEVKPDEARDTPGLTTAQTMVSLAAVMNQRWLPNDFLWPTRLMDNPQNFQLGYLEGLRYTVRVMRDKVTRLRTTDKIDKDMEAAFVLLSNDPTRWILPSSETKYRAAEARLEKYRENLAQGQAHFYPRADNLNELLDQYISILGGENTKLSNAPRFKGQEHGLSEETAGDEYTQGETYTMRQTPWRQIDDNFYHARGVAFVLRHMMIAIKYDFANILKIKNAGELVDLIIERLDQAQFEPLIVLNGSRGAVFANHSLQLQSLLEDARQKMASLQDMLNQ